LLGTASVAAFGFGTVHLDDIKTQKGLMTSKNLNMMPRPIGGFMMSAPFASQLALCAEK
jgi:hypothetical protein